MQQWHPWITCARADGGPPSSRLHLAPLGLAESIPGLLRAASGNLLPLARMDRKGHRIGEGCADHPHAAEDDTDISRARAEVWGGQRTLLDGHSRRMDEALPEARLHRYPNRRLPGLQGGGAAASEGARVGRRGADRKQRASPS